MAKVGLNLAAMCSCCQIPDLLLVNTLKRIRCDQCSQPI